MLHFIHPRVFVRRENDEANAPLLVSTSGINTREQGRGMNA